MVSHLPNHAREYLTHTETSQLSHLIGRLFDEIAYEREVIDQSWDDLVYDGEVNA